MADHQIFFIKPNQIVPLCLVLLSFALQAQTTDDEKIIFELEKQRNHAVAQHDEKTLSDLFDETYSGVTPSGKVLNKSEQLNIYKSTNPYVTFTAEDVSASVYETTAVVRGTSVGKAKSGSVIGQTRYLYVYLKRDGRWRIKVGQETVVIKE
jgi:hypothetical protein